MSIERVHVLEKAIEKAIWNLDRPVSYTGEARKILREALAHKAEPVPAADPSRESREQFYEGKQLNGEPDFTETSVGEFHPVKPVPEKRIGGVDLRAGMKANDALDREIATEEYLNDSGRDKPVPENGPVVKYYRITDYLYRVIDGKCDEVVEPAKRGIYPQIPWQFMQGCHLSQVTHHEYESAKDAAKQPDAAEKVPIERLHPDQFGRAEHHDKINEIVAWINDKAQF